MNEAEHECQATEQGPARLVPGNSSTIIRQLRTLKSILIWSMGLTFLYDPISHAQTLSNSLGLLTAPTYELSLKIAISCPRILQRGCAPGTQNSRTLQHDDQNQYKAIISRICWTKFIPPTSFGCPRRGLRRPDSDAS
jgi:hypothetical protein